MKNIAVSQPAQWSK